MPVRPQKDHILIVADEKGKRDFILSHEFYILGRGKDCSIRIRSQFVSRHHAVLRHRLHNNQLYYEIEDGDGQGHESVNGLLINDEKKKKHILQDGDKIVFGPNIYAIYYYSQRDQFTPKTQGELPENITKEEVTKEAVTQEMTTKNVTKEATTKEDQYDITLIDPGKQHGGDTAELDSPPE